MQQLVLTQFGEPEESLQLADVPEPTPGPGEVLVRLEAAPINPSDVLLIQGRYLARPKLPAAAGTEGVGIVEGVGADVDDAIVGKRVVILPVFKYGTWSQKVAAAETDVVEVGEADALQLSMLSINPVTAHHLLERIVHLQLGDWVGQTAANSAVGLHVAALARRRGVRTLNVVRREAAAEEVRRAGGDVVLVSGPGLDAEIARELRDERLSLVLDPLGGPVATHLISALNFAGTAVTYGSLTGPPSGVTSADLFAREVRYTGFWLGNWYSRASRREIGTTLSYLAGLIADEVLSTPVEATYHPQDYLKAFQHAQRTQRGGKVLFRFD